MFKNLFSGLDCLDFWTFFHLLLETFCSIYVKKTKLTCMKYSN